MSHPKWTTHAWLENFAFVRYRPHIDVGGTVAEHCEPAVIPDIVFSTKDDEPSITTTTTTGVPSKQESWRMTSEWHQRGDRSTTCKQHHSDQCRRTAQPTSSVEVWNSTNSRLGTRQNWKCYNTLPVWCSSNRVDYSFRQFSLGYAQTTQ